MKISSTHGLTIHYTEEDGYYATGYLLRGKGYYPQTENLEEFKAKLQEHLDKKHKITKGTPRVEKFPTGQKF